MRTVINWGVFRIFGVLIIGFLIAGFLVPHDAQTDDGYPLRYFLWFMGGMFLLSTGGVVLWARASNRRRARIEQNWLDAEAKILEVSETGTYINNQPKLRFRLHVESPMHPPREVVHKQVIPLLVLSQYQVGQTITVKVNPEDPDEILLT